MSTMILLKMKERLKITSNSHRLVQKLLLFCHRDQQLHGRNHKGPQRIELHRYQSRRAVPNVAPRGMSNTTHGERVQYTK